MPKIVEDVLENGLTGEIFIVVGDDVVHPDTGGPNYARMRLEVNGKKFYARGFVPKKPGGRPTVSFTIIPDTLNSEELESLTRALVQFSAALQAAEALAAKNFFPWKTSIPGSTMLQ